MGKKKKEATELARKIIEHAKAYNIPLAKKPKK